VGYGSAFLPGGAPGWAPWLYALGGSGAMVSLMALGAVRPTGLGRLGPALALLFVLLAGGFAAVLLLPPPGATPPGIEPVLWLGLPPGAAVLIYGLGLLPFLVVPVAYAWTFPGQVLAEGELEEIRERALAARRSAPPGPGTDPPASGSPPSGSG
jgi:hypothetical protein